MDWKKVDEYLTKTIITLVEEIPKGDGIETKITIVYPSRINDLFEDYNDVFEFQEQILNEEYILKHEYHIDFCTHLQIYEKTPYPEE